jgi:LmbE family N-acetylglucosaminyl deacetylase
VPVGDGRLPGVATLVTFHAHPDDEAIAVAGTMARASAAGHRVILVTATRGELGEPVPGVLAEGEPLWERRVAETHEAARIAGAARVAFLGYEDSGMMGEPTNDNPACFWQADLEEAAGRLAAILTEEGADILTVYDDHGGYGHPDHIQVHRVGVRAAELAGVRHVFESTMNRTHLQELMAQAEADGVLADDTVDGEERRAVATDMTFGSPAELITHAVDVSAFLDRKRQAMIAHASQIAPDSFFLAMPPEAFAGGFGTEWYIERGRPRAADAAFATDLFAVLADADASAVR